MSEQILRTAPLSCCMVGLVREAEPYKPGRITIMFIKFAHSITVRKSVLAGERDEMKKLLSP